MAKRGTYFTFLGQSSRTLGYLMVDFDGGSDTPLALSREIEAGEMNRYRSRPNHFGACFTEPLSFEVHLIKDPAAVPVTSRKISTEEFSRIAAWLTASEVPSRLTFDETETNKEALSYLAVVRDIQPFEAGDLYGIRILFQCDSPYAYSPLITQHIEADSTASFETCSDLWNDYLYPVIHIQPSATGLLTITNETDGGRSLSVNVRAGNDITIDCRSLIIRDTAGILTLLDLGMEDVDEIYWPRLLGKGANKISLSGSGAIDIQYREPRKAGALS